MLIETQVVRSKSELSNEIQRMPIAKAVVYRNFDSKAWQQIVKEHQGVRGVIVVISIL